jgi:4-carboxymuconolactone decarboxylase
MSTPRIAPLEPPYDPDIAESLAKWMPPGSKIEPLKLFRTLVRSPEISSRLRALGAGILGPGSLIAPRDREILIDRTAALCGCEYEWGVHAAAFGEAVGLTPEALRATAAAPPTTPFGASAMRCWFVWPMNCTTPRTFPTNYGPRYRRIGTLRN